MPSPLWHFDDFLSSIEGGYGEWRLMVLAPLASIAACNGVQRGELAELIHCVCSRHLLAHGAEQSDEASAGLRRLVDDEALRCRYRAKFFSTLDTLPEPHREEIANRLWEAAVDLTRSAFTSGGIIDEAERIDLLGLAIDLRFGDLPAVSSALGGISRLLSIPSAFELRRSTATTDAPIASNLSITPAAWATQWADLKQSAWEDLSALVDHYEQAAYAGKGHLDDVKHFHAGLLQSNSVLDSGVLLLGKEVQNLVVIGDLHGDAPALEAAIAASGFETDESVQLLFLGDYGDRGAGTLAVWLRLAQLHRAQPHRIHLLRGNHEEMLPVTCKRADGSNIARDWAIPGTADSESYLALAFALESNVNNVAVVYDCLPTIAILPDGTVAVHGGPVPGFKSDDSWPGNDADHAGLEVACLADLRKPVAQKAMRWTDILDRGEVSQAWAEWGRSSRLYAAGDDVKAWQKNLSISRFVHGHVHPPEGFRLAHEGDALALNTSRMTGKQPAIARWQRDQAWLKIDLQL